MNAIILAAGVGTRLIELTIDNPKALIKIDNEPIIERQIRYLHEIGVKEIYIVIGYKATLFEYLIAKYQVNLIYNPHYLSFNNFYSLYMARHVLADSYIFDGDVFLSRNFLNVKLQKSTYFSIKKRPILGEWILTFSNNLLRDITIVDELNASIFVFNDETYVLSGVSFWAHQDIQVILDFFEKAIDSTGVLTEVRYGSLFWDHIIYENMSKLLIEVLPINSDDLYEIDNMSDYLKAKAFSSRKKSDISI